ncbi:hypothetical protein [Corynebacterium aquatimens]|uniref:Uncharacterized protein n=1 Tax=Corynebacterium aquatimens TaxID=1190508 RepID=A0A931DXF6_9CORY|nr:hypothetical protein [Corynebacterium aquatimens]MBG6122072.1 hypothetical protein [Corynebacterium aquatimens]WJY65387.1 hypothetical protein CAQUA_03350 [Corynebacterium aquatimens]
MSTPTAERARDKRTWVWRGQKLIDESSGAYTGSPQTGPQTGPQAGPQKVLAYVDGNTLYVGDQTIVLDHSAGTMRWTLRGSLRGGSAAEADYRMGLRGSTVNKVSATCGERSYTLDRVNLFSARRLIRATNGAPVAEISVIRGTSIRVTLLAELTDRTDRTDEQGAQENATTLMDLAFMTWGLTLLDAAARRTLR